MAQNSGDLFDYSGLKQIFDYLNDQAMNRPETLAKNAVTDDVVKMIHDHALYLKKIGQYDLLVEQTLQFKMNTQIYLNSLKYLEILPD